MGNFYCDFLSHNCSLYMTSLNYLNYDMKNFQWFLQFPKQFLNLNKFLKFPWAKKKTWRLTFSKLLYSQSLFSSPFFGIIIKWGFLIPSLYFFHTFTLALPVARTIERIRKLILKKLHKIYARLKIISSLSDFSNCHQKSIYSLPDCF